MRNTLLASLLVAFVALMGSQQALATGYKYNSYKTSYKTYYKPYKSYKKTTYKKKYTKYNKYKKYKKYYWVKPKPVSAW